MGTPSLKTTGEGLKRPSLPQYLVSRHKVGPSLQANTARKSENDVFGLLHTTSATPTCPAGLL